jgi:hypothetical protein
MNESIEPISEEQCTQNCETMETIPQKESISTACNSDEEKTRTHEESGRGNDSKDNNNSSKSQKVHKTVKPRSPKQILALEKAQLARKVKAEHAKMNKESLSTSKHSDDVRIHQIVENYLRMRKEEEDEEKENQRPVLPVTKIQREPPHVRFEENDYSFRQQIESGLKTFHRKQSNQTPSYIWME